MGKSSVVPYFDHNATTPLAPVARAAWLRAVDESWQNPSSPYRDAARVRVRLEQAREKVAEMLECPPAQVVFNSGATEGANAVFAHWAGTLAPDRMVAVNPTEHPCVIEAALHALPTERVAWLEVDQDGTVRMDCLEAMLVSGAVGAVSVMAANNETGVIQPWREIGALCRRHHVAYHCDAAQWLGKLPAGGLGGVDWMTSAAHKFGGPKGTGFLKLPSAESGFRGQVGGEQEHGHRAGTEDYPTIVAAVAALAEAETAKVLHETIGLNMRDRFVADLRAVLPGVRVAGEGGDRLWNTVSLILPRGENVRWVAKLDRCGFQVSTGSACAAGRQGPSHVLAAMGVTPEEARRVIRISAGWETTEEDWRGLLAALGTVAGEIGSEAVSAP